MDNLEVRPSSNDMNISSDFISLDYDIAGFRTSGTYIDKSTACALAQRFLNEVRDRLNDTMKSSDFRDMFTHGNRHNSRKRWKIQSRKFKKIVSKQPSHFYECGSKSHPAFVASVWGVEKIDGRGFDEPVLVCRNFTSQYGNPGAQREVADLAPLIVTKHALTRIFERIPMARELTGTGWSFEWVASVIAPVLTWSGFWVERSYSRLQKLKDVMNLESKIRPIIPSKYGLFLCEFDANCDQPLVVKTFVDTGRLREKQVLVRDIMINAAADLDVLRLPLSPFLIFGVNYAFSSWVLTARLGRYQDKFEDLLFACSEPLAELFKELDFFHLEHDNTPINKDELPMELDPKLIFKYLSDQFG
jgi:hypothetical protein